MNENVYFKNKRQVFATKKKDVSEFFSNKNKIIKKIN